MLNLLDHPFYQARTMGQVTPQTLANYGASYQHLVDAIPQLWAQAIDGLGARSEGQRVIDEENEHITLWKNRRASLAEANKDYDTTQTIDTINTLKAMSPSKLLGALHAFESQQPDVAVSKKAGLIKWYNQSGSALDYFDEHMKEEKHIQFGLRLAAAKANMTEFEAGVEEGASLWYHTLDQFVPSSSF